MLIVAALTSLFLDVDVVVAGARVRPFDGLVLMMLLHLLFVRGVSIRIPFGLILCGLFFLMHAASAVALGPANFLREGIQVAVVFVFALYVYNMLEPDCLPRLLVVFTVLVILVMAYNVLWHVLHGYNTGWKRLNAPKAAFLFSCMMLSYYALKDREGSHRGTLVATIAFLLLLPLFLLSGERKALVFFMICSCIYLVRTKPFLRPAGWLAILAASLITLPIIPDLLTIPYVSHQVTSMLSPLATSGLQIYSSGEYFSESLSNAQRVFAAEQGWLLLLQHPIVGIGTNGYQEIIKADFPYLPPVMRNSIHSEFLRVLVENGAVGILAYCMPLIRSGSFVALHTTSTSSSDGRLLLVVGAFILLSMESSGSILMVLYVVIGILPDLVRRFAVMQKSEIRCFSEPVIVASTNPSAGRGS